MKKILLSISLVAAFCQLSTAQSVWQVSTIAGNGTQGYSGDSGPATAAQLTFNNSIVSMCKDAAGNLYVADQGNKCIRKITTAGVISTFAPDINFGGSWNQYAGLCIDPSGNLYAANGNGYTYKILKITPAGIVNTLVNNNPNFSTSNGMCTDTAGNIYVADRGGAVFKITPAGLVSLYVNFSSLSFTPEQLCMDNSGNMFVICDNNGEGVIQKVTQVVW